MTSMVMGTFLVVGLFAGVLSGFFGVGGGIVIVPVLVMGFGMAQQQANGTSLIALLGPVGLMGVWAYYQAGAISVDNIKSGVMIAIGMFIGAYFGARLAVNISSETLRKVFCVFLVLVAARLWFK